MSAVHFQKLQPIGVFFPQKETGEILNPTHSDLIPAHWLPAVAEVKDAYLKHFGPQIHSIWLRGSVPRGMAVDYCSDLDIFALIHEGEEYRWEPVPFEVDLNQRFKTKYPFIDGVEAKKSTFLPNLAFKKPKIAMLIKTQSLCLAGEDIKEKLPACFPGDDVMLHYRWLEADLEHFLKIKEPELKDYQTIAKVIIRVGHELVIKQVGSYTTDLYLCWRTFAHYYPAKAAEMLLFLNIFVNSLEVNPDDQELVAQFGRWLLNEVHRTLL